MGCLVDGDGLSHGIRHIQYHQLLTQWKGGDGAVAEVDGGVGGHGFVIKGRPMRDPGLLGRYENRDLQLMHHQTPFSPYGLTLNTPSLGRPHFMQEGL